MKNAILRDKLTTNILEKSTKTHKMYLDSDVIGADKPIPDLIFCNEEIRRNLLKQTVDVFNDRLLENFGVLV